MVSLLVKVIVISFVLKVVEGTAIAPLLLSVSKLVLVFVFRASEGATASIAALNWTLCDRGGVKVSGLAIDFTF